MGCFPVVSIALYFTQLSGRKAYRMQDNRSPNRPPNRLVTEKSPYLLQHAYNPVDWYPWGTEAFEKASREGKPVFLSIGYSTCHWCHVMAHESFEDDEVATILNRDFVSIKVDREERPDIDSIYMSVCQALTGEGGWPLTIVMTPDKRPFFAGTYFPKDRKYGRLGLVDLLNRLTREWKQNREKIESMGDTVAEAISRHHEGERSDSADIPSEPSRTWIEDAFLHLDTQFDESYGGFGNAPKFPTPHNLSFLLRYGVLTGNPRAIQMVTKTLDAMREGGIWDEVGFGFSRYSVDRMWRIPHFEKMLYDNALLAIAYLEAYQVTEDAKYAGTAKLIFEYVIRDMTSQDGAFYSALDADSEGEEGKFYAWGSDEFRTLLAEVLDAKDVDLVCEYYKITDYGNFEGKNILNTIQVDKAAFCQQHGRAIEEFDRILGLARRTLFQAREKRVHPHLDDKILTSWNGLMIAALAKGAQVLGEKRYVDEATRAVNFILLHMRQRDGRLLARYRDGEAAIPAYLDDYAFFIWGLIELYEATFDPSHLRLALEFTNQMVALFEDSVVGGYFLTGHDSELLLTRPKEIYDGALPSGNSVATENFFRLARLTGNPALEQRGDDCLRAFAQEVSRYPAGYTHTLMALMYALYPSREIVVVGEPVDHQYRAMIRAIHSRLLPTSVWLAGVPGHFDNELFPFATGYQLLNGKTAAYVCERFACKAPTSDITKLEGLLDVDRNESVM